MEADEYDLMSQWQRSHRSLGIRSLQSPEQEVTASDLSRKTRVREKRELCAHSHKPQSASGRESINTPLHERITAKHDYVRIREGKANSCSTAIISFGYQTNLL